MEKIYNRFTSGIEMNYVVFTPREKVENLPLIVYLHGAGERGNNIEHIFRHGLPAILNGGKEIPAIVLCPQCPERYVWDNVVTFIKELIDLTVSTYKCDISRISITGSSMGGFGTFMMGLTYTDMFSCIVPVSGGAMSWRASNLASTPVLAIHGENDDLVPIIYSKLMVEKINQTGGNAKLIILNKYGHNDAIDYAYTMQEVIDFMLNSKRISFERVKEFCSELF